MYHGLIIDKEFIDENFPNNFKIFNKKRDGSWGIYGIEIEDSELMETINNIQMNMKSDENWYTHFYNNEKLIVVFRNKIFEITPDKGSWQPVIDYGKELNIPEEQLDFWPNKFEDEVKYFAK